MFETVHPKLRMRNRAVTKHYFIDQLGFKEIGNTAYEDYFMIRKDYIDLHFFKFEKLNQKQIYGKIYSRTKDV
jgi:hypothetical protein